jgi:hypothetical protein
MSSQVAPFPDDRTPIRFTDLVAREWDSFTHPPGYDAD